MLLNNSSRSCGTLESLRENFTRRCSSVPPAYPPTLAMIMSVQTELLFTIRDTGFVNVYAYRVSSEAEEEFKRSYLVMKPIGLVLEDFQFKVDMPGQIAGRSGALHRFDAVATKGSSEVVVLDVIASDKEIDEVPVASMYAKIFDVSPSQSILVAIPGLTDRAKRLAALYRVSIVEAENSQRAADQIKDKFGWAGLSGSDESFGDLQL